MFVSDSNSVLSLVKKWSGDTIYSVENLSYMKLLNAFIVHELTIHYQHPQHPPNFWMKDWYSLRTFWNKNKNTDSQDSCQTNEWIKTCPFCVLPHIYSKQEIIEINAKLNSNQELEHYNQYLTNHPETFLNINQSSSNLAQS